MPGPLNKETDELLRIWSENWESLAVDKDSVDAVLEGIERTREKILELLQSLD